MAFTVVPLAEFKVAALLHVKEEAPLAVKVTEVLGQIVDDDGVIERINPEFIDTVAVVEFVHVVAEPTIV